MELLVSPMWDEICQYIKNVIGGFNLNLNFIKIVSSIIVSYTKTLQRTYNGWFWENSISYTFDPAEAKLGKKHWIQFELNILEAILGSLSYDVNKYFDVLSTNGLVSQIVHGKYPWYKQIIKFWVIQSFLVILDLLSLFPQQIICNV